MANFLEVAARHWVFTLAFTWLLGYLLLDVALGNVLRVVIGMWNDRQEERKALNSQERAKRG